ILLLMIFIVLRSNPRPYTILIFFGLQLAVFQIDISFWGNGTRFIFAMLLSSMAVIIEVVYRQLPRGQKIAAGATFVVTGAWYIATVCACASGAI
ncbi:MAG: hypothetical protein P8J27_02145, partial [Mariniblastus sp.]|nr:hypothetical protein [Mariniblastus sp.]